MSKRFAAAWWISTAVLLVLAIFLWSNLLEASPQLQNYLSLNGEASVLAADANGANALIDTAAEVGLTVEIPKQNATLSYSTQAEVFTFTLKAAGPYTLRYLTLQVDAVGLKPIDSWTLYEMNYGQVDFTKPVGNSEEHEGDLLRFRLFSSRSAAYLGEAGEQTFVVVASVLKDPDSTEPASLAFSFPAELPPTMNWAWLPRQHSEVWLNVEGSLDSSEVEGLGEK